jgi:DNA-binding CsgD family transcriptional regulator
VLSVDTAQGTGVDAILELIDNIYEAGAHPEQWQRALLTLADRMGCIDATMGGQTAAQVPLLVTARTDPDNVRSYAEHYHTRNALQLAVHAVPVGQAVLDSALLDIADFQRGAFFNEWCRPQGYLRGGALNLATSQGWRATLMVSGRKEYDSEALGILSAMTPHLIRAFQLNQLLHETQAMGLGAFAALEYLDRGALLVGAGGKVRPANHLAEAILEGGDGLTLRDGQLTCADRAETATLHRLIAQCSRGIAVRDEGTMQVTRSEGRGPLTVQCLPFPASNWWPGFNQQLAMIFVTDPDARMVQATERLRQRYGLTPAEARLAWEIVRGGGRKAAAQSRGISVATARSQLTSIFDKTGVRRQSELVRLLLDD